jgi:hypothetical protein
MAMTGGAAIALFVTVAGHSDWELGGACLCVLLVIFGAYWMVAALKGWPPFGGRGPTQDATPQPPRPAGGNPRVIIRKTGDASLVRPRFRGPGTAIDNAGKLNVEDGDFGDGDG